VIIITRSLIALRFTSWSQRGRERESGREGEKGVRREGEREGGIVDTLSKAPRTLLMLVVNSLLQRHCNASFSSIYYFIMPQSRYLKAIGSPLLFLRRFKPVFWVVQSRPSISDAVLRHGHLDHKQTTAGSRPTGRPLCLDSRIPWCPPVLHPGQSGRRAGSRVGEGVRVKGAGRGGHALGNSRQRPWQLQ
jgi:hypothetical protein